MIKIQKIHIQRFRSIMDLKILVNIKNNLITLCGENNTGKTNTLRAINLFFNPQKYIPKNDTPHHKYYGSRGGSVFPTITIEFIKDDKDVYKITRKFDLSGLQKTEGVVYKLSDKRNKKRMTEHDIENFFKKIAFFFIESININFPEFINNLIEDLYDIEFEKSRFSGLKADLKKAFDKYTKGLLEILNKLADEIKPLFREYHKDWGIKFAFKSDVKKFRDIITDDIEFYIDDKSNRVIEAKGSGLQRLAYLLLHFRMIEKITSKSVILLIDEPDIFLQQGLQKKLLEHLRLLTKKSQIFITTHSPIFIDSYTLDNVFLLEQNIEKTEYVRKEQSYYILKTTLVDISKVDGAKKIRSYLGIAEYDYDLLDNYNIIVEGETDKVYLEELMKYFKLHIPKIIPVHGANNIQKYLDFYNSYYKAKDNKPMVLILLDNDQTGREVCRKIISKEYNQLLVYIKFIPNYLGEFILPEKLEGINTNHEIEDFIYPKVICFLTNQLLNKKGLRNIDTKKVCKLIQTPSHKNNGILFLLENEKNNKNPERGVEVAINSEGFKKGLANSFRIEGNRRLITLLQEENEKYPEVRKFLIKISDLENIKKDGE